MRAVRAEKDRVSIASDRHVRFACARVGEVIA